MSEQLSRLARANTEVAMARERDKGGLERIMEMIIQMRAEDKKEAQLREEKRDREERQREQMRLEGEETRVREVREQKEADLRREERLLTTLKVAQAAVPQHVTIQNQKLPEMKDTDEVELFVTMFEAALLSNLVPEAQWKNKLHAHLSMGRNLRFTKLCKTRTPVMRRSRRPC